MLSPVLPLHSFSVNRGAAPERVGKPVNLVTNDLTQSSVFHVELWRVISNE